MKTRGFNFTIFEVRFTALDPKASSNHWCWILVHTQSTSSSPLSKRSSRDLRGESCRGTGLVRYITYRFSAMTDTVFFLSLFFRKKYCNIYYSLTASQIPFQRERDERNRYLVRRLRSWPIHNGFRFHRYNIRNRVSRSPKHPNGTVLRFHPKGRKKKEKGIVKREKELSPGAERNRPSEFWRSEDRFWKAVPTFSNPMRVAELFSQETTWNPILHVTAFFN